MKYTIRDNEGNIVCSVENTTPTNTTLSYESINAEFDKLKAYSNSINKSIEAFNFINDTRAMEALGYVKGAGFKDNIKTVGKEIWKKIKYFFISIGKAFGKFWEAIKGIFGGLKNKILKNKKKTEDTLNATIKAANSATSVNQMAKALIVMNKAKPSTDEVFLQTLKMAVNETPSIQENSSSPSTTQTPPKVIITPAIEEKVITAVSDKLSQVLNSKEAERYFNNRDYRNGATGSSSNVIENATNKFISAGNKLYGMIKSYHGSSDSEDAAFEKKIKPVYDIILSIKFSEKKETSEEEKIKYLKNILADLEKNISNLDNIISRYGNIVKSLNDLAEKFASIIPDTDEDFDALPKAIQNQTINIKHVIERFNSLSVRIKDESFMYAKLINFCTTI